MVNKALAAGAKPSIDLLNHGFMYERGFQNIDGHRWEFVYMDMSAIEQS